MYWDGDAATGATGGSGRLSTRHSVCEGASMYLIRAHQRAVQSALIVGYVFLLGWAGWLFTHLH